MSLGSAYRDFSNFLEQIAKAYGNISLPVQVLEGIGSLFPKTPDFPLPDAVQDYVKTDPVPSNLTSVTQGATPKLGPNREGKVLSEGGFFRDPTQLGGTAMGAAQYAEGGAVSDKGIKALFKAILNDGLEEGVASYLGISQEDTDWASSIGERYGLSPSKRDAARHVALGWLASKTETPGLAKFFADAREYRPIAGGPIVSRRMDLENNDIGYNLPAEDKVQAEQMILDLVDQGKVNTDDPSGYARGGGVASLAPVAKNMFRTPGIRRGIGSFASN